MRPKYVVAIIGSLSVIGAALISTFGERPQNIVVVVPPPKVDLSEVDPPKVDSPLINRPTPLAKPPAKKRDPTGASKGLAGEWQFEVRVYKGINSSGVRSARGDTYPAEVEIDEHGRGIFDGSPMIGCAIGPIEITRAGDAVSWVLDCKDKCEGSQRVFKGKLVDEGKGLLLEGEQKPVGPPTSPGCWLPYEELTGRRIRS